jgi:hypothetical protein
MKKAIIIVNVFVLIFAGTAFSAFDDIGIGARPLGMGGAFVAVADDANASAYNPAGLSYIKKAQAGFTHLRMFSGVVDYNYASAAIPLGNFGNLGMSFGILGEESGVYNEKNIAFSYSRRIINALSVGANVRMLSTGFDEKSVAGNDYFAETSASGVTLDIGLLVKPVSGLSIGFAGENIAPVDVSISKSDEEKVPMNLRFGLAFNFSAVAGSAQQPALKEILETTVISFEGGSRKERETNAIKVKAGIESWFANNTVGLRAGYNMKKVDVSSSSITLGGSIRIPVTGFSLRLDYAVQVFGNDLEDKLAHRISVTMSL